MGTPSLLRRGSQKLCFSTGPYERDRQLSNMRPLFFVALASQQWYSAPLGNRRDYVSPSANCPTPLAALIINSPICSLLGKNNAHAVEVASPLVRERPPKYTLLEGRTTSLFRSQHSSQCCPLLRVRCSLVLDSSSLFGSSESYH